MRSSDFDHADFDAQLAVRRAQFEADIAAADYDQALRQRLGATPPSS